jgi:hypothetical protein
MTMSYYAMQNSVARLAVKFSVAASALALSACASFNTNVNTDNCTEQDIGAVGIPLVMEIGGQGKASFKKTCQAGYHIGVVPMLGQKQDGTLAPASIIIFHKKYFEELLVSLQNKINTTPPDDVPTDPKIKELTETKTFADHFLGTLSGGRLNAAILKTMYDKKIINPDLINPDGTLKPVEENPTPPQAPQQEKFVCSGDSIIRKCTPKPN